MPTPSRKRARKNQRQRDRKKRQTRKETERAQHFVVRGNVEHRECRFDMFISAPDEYAQPIPINAVIDTGATGISIRPDIAVAAGLQVVGFTDVRTASDLHTSPVAIAVLHLHADGRTIQMLSTVVIEQGLGDDMLFGMDGLEGGMLIVDRINETWEIRIKRLGPPPDVPKGG